MINFIQNIFNQRAERQRDNAAERVISLLHDPYIQTIFADLDHVENVKEQIQSLLTKDININYQKELTFTTILHSLSNFKHDYFSDVLDLVLQKKPDPEMTDCFGNTPLDLSTLSSSMYVFKKILNYTAQYKKNDPYIKALISCTEIKTFSIQKFLLLIGNGADPSAKDNNGKSFFDHARQNNRQDLIDLAEQFIADKEAKRMAEITDVHLKRDIKTINKIKLKGRKGP